jgi:hypothetical protein
MTDDDPAVVTIAPLLDYYRRLPLHLKGAQLLLLAEPFLCARFRLVTKA